MDILCRYLVRVSLIGFGILDRDVTETCQVPKSVW